MIQKMLITKSMKNKGVKMIISRMIKNSKQVTSIGAVINKNDKVLFYFNALELPYNNNEIKKSSIKTGTYWVFKAHTPRFKDCFILKDVEGRSGIYIHSGNFFKDTTGCILVGRGFYDVNSDGFQDVTHSRSMLNDLYSVMQDTFDLVIK